MPGLGNWGKASEHKNGQREGAGLDLRWASERAPGMSIFKRY